MHRANNFDMLRLVFAVVVVLVHCSELSFNPALAFIPRFLNAGIAVEGFFVISGFLVLGSYTRTQAERRQGAEADANARRTLSVYLEKRARRILPAYWLALLFALVLGSVFTALPAGAFWRSTDTWKFIAANLTFLNYLHPSLPGLFAHGSRDSGVNGALWTIKLEVMFYLMVPVIVTLCRKWGRIPVLATIYLLSVLFQSVVSRLHHPMLAKQLPGELCFFILGSAAFYYFDRLRAYKTLLWIAGVSAFPLTYAGGGVFCESIGVAALVLCFAFFFPHVDGPTKYGDFSYGIYLFHYPVVQTLIAVGLFASHPYVATLFVVMVVTALAVLSWNFIEKRALGLKGNAGRDAIHAPRMA